MDTDKVQKVLERAVRVQRAAVWYPSHPVWSIARTFVLGLIIVPLVLFGTAKDVTDGDEIFKSLLILIGLGGGDALLALRRKHKDANGEPASE